MYNTYFCYLSLLVDVLGYIILQVCGFLVLLRVERALSIETLFVRFVRTVLHTGAFHTPPGHVEIFTSVNRAAIGLVSE